MILLKPWAEFWARVMLANTVWLITVFELDDIDPEWIEHPIEQNISSTILSSIEQGEREIKSGAPVSTLDEE